MKVGDYEVELFPNQKVSFESVDDFAIYGKDKDGEFTKLLVLSSDKKAILKTEHWEPDEDGQISSYVVKVVNAVDEAALGTYSLEQSPSPYEDADPIPVEIPEEMKRPETLEEKMQRFLVAAVIERYGQNSNEFETFEESMDLDLEDEDAHLLSGYEVPEMREEVPSMQVQDGGETGTAGDSEGGSSGGSEPPGEEE